MAKAPSHQPRRHFLCLPLTPFRFLFLPFSSFFPRAKDNAAAAAAAAAAVKIRKGRACDAVLEFSGPAAMGGAEKEVEVAESFTDSAEDECRGSSISSSSSSAEAMSLLSVSDKAKQHTGDAEENEADIKGKSRFSETEMMKERFSKLLLGEDMSGSGKGVCTALAISNAITNLCATLFGQLWRLEPLPPEKKAMWRREMEWLLCVSDHIVELMPTWQTFPDGSKLEIMTTRPRTDLFINLPALKKLDNMLLEILDSFGEAPEFWYVDQGISAPDCSDGSASLRRVFHRREEKWWLPVPRVPAGGLQVAARRQLQHKRECANQILKAAMAINSNALAEMDVPDSYLDSLPKNGRATLGDIIHRYIASDHFSPECLLDCLDLSSEYQALEIANRVEAAVYVWRRRAGVKSASSTPHPAAARSSWSMVKDMLLDTDKRELLAERAEALLICLKQRFPGLTQTSLDMSKIQFNRDVGKSILESYSRVLESLASNIVARIDDLLYVDDMSRHSDAAPAEGSKAHAACPCSVPASATPFATAYTTPSFSPAQLASPANKLERAILVDRRPHHGRGIGAKRALADSLGAAELMVKISNSLRDDAGLSTSCRSLGVQAPI